MALLDIVIYPDHHLREIAKPIAEVNNEIRQLAEDMLETMYNAPGIGLAATQVGIAQRIAVIDVSEEQDQPMVMINPEISNKQGEREHQEGCLSIPNAYEMVTRADTLTLKALDKDGQPYQIEADGLLATCIQHELDHLDGKLFIDYLSNLKRQRIIKKQEKLAKQRA